MVVCIVISSKTHSRVNVTPKPANTVKVTLFLTLVCSNILLSPAYSVYISQLTQYARTCSTYDYLFLYSRQFAHIQADVTEASTVLFIGSFTVVTTI
jgi:hypothetical protein